MMDHGHGHDVRRAQGANRTADRRALKIVLALTATFTVAEAVAGVLTGSLALLADAGHMLSDDVSLGLALFAVWLAGRPATSRRTFGYQRAEILAALANGVTLVAIAIWIFIEAARRFSDPPEIAGEGLLIVAALGLVVNLTGLAILTRRSGESLNVTAALRHLLADLLGSLGVIVAGVVILTTGWRYVDPLVSVAIGVLVLGSSWSILRDSTRILLEATPAGIDAAELGRRMAAAPGVVEVHDLHVWTITSGFPALSAHVLVRPGDDCHERRRQLAALLADEFGIEHTTLQVDHGREQGLLSLGSLTPAKGAEENG